MNTKDRNTLKLELAALTQQRNYFARFDTDASRARLAATESRISEINALLSPKPKVRRPAPTVLIHPATGTVPGGF